MIHSMLENDIRAAVNKAENLNKNGTINWNFVDAEVYACNFNLWKDDGQFYESFDEIVRRITAEQIYIAIAKQQAKPVKPTGIEYVAAHYGRIQMTTIDGKTVNAGTVEEGATWIKILGIATSVFASSSMDFASEEGFGSDNAAHILWSKMVTASKVEAV